MTFRRWIAVVLLVVGVGFLYRSFRHVDFMGFTSDGYRLVAVGAVLSVGSLVLLVWRGRR